jgi:hypothetical protein
VTLAESRTEFEAAGYATAELNGHGPGFSTRCPNCPEEITVRPSDDGTNVVIDCPSGCTREKIGHELHFRTARAADARTENDKPPASCWVPVDLAPILAGDAADEQPDILLGTDGVGLFYQGRLHAVYGEPEACKGWLALAATADSIRAGDPVLYIDYEDTAANVAVRLRALGVPTGGPCSEHRYRLEA